MAEIATFEVRRIDGCAELADVTAKLIGELPSWFGIPEANAAYVEAAGHLPGLVAHDNGQAVGVLLYRRHFPVSAEIELMAVAPSWHRRGVGRALVSAVESALEPGGCRVLQVKTLGAAHPDRGYAGTRAFYRSMGFLPLEETSDLWPGNPCLIMVKGLDRPAGG